MSLLKFYHQRFIMGKVLMRIVDLKVWLSTMVTFKNSSGWFALPADITLAMQQSLETRFATYRAILKFSKKNTSWSKARSIVILYLKFSYFVIQNLVIFSKQVSRSQKFLIFEIFQNFHELLIGNKLGLFFSKTYIRGE